MESEPIFDELMSFEREKVEIFIQIGTMVQKFDQKTVKSINFFESAPRLKQKISQKPILDSCRESRNLLYPHQISWLSFKKRHFIVS